MVKQYVLYCVMLAGLYRLLLRETLQKAYVNTREQVTKRIQSNG